MGASAVCRVPYDETEVGSNLSSANRIGPGGLDGGVVLGSGITRRGAMRLSNALEMLLAGDDETAVHLLGDIEGEDIGLMFNICGNLMSKLVAAASIKEVTAVLDAAVEDVVTSNLENLGVLKSETSTESEPRQ